MIKEVIVVPEKIIQIDFDFETKEVFTVTQSDQVSPGGGGGGGGGH